MLEDQIEKLQDAEDADDAGEEDYIGFLTGEVKVGRQRVGVQDR